jgi:hypothetical protein
MLGILEDLLKKAVSLKNVENEACRNGLLIILANKITNHYRFLIPNERNKREVAAFQEWMENAPVVNDGQQSNEEFALFFVLKSELEEVNPSSERLLDFLKENSIILKQNDNEVTKFKEYYKPFTTKGDSLIRSHYAFKRSEQRRPYEEAFNQYLSNLMFKENIEFNRINFDYKFHMNIDLTYPIEDYKENLISAIGNTLNDGGVLTRIKKRVKNDLKGLYFEDLCTGVTRVKYCIPFSSLREYGFSGLEEFEEYHGENKKEHVGRNPFGYKYDVSEKFSLIVTKKEEEHNIVFCRVKFKSLEPMDLFQRLYEKELSHSVNG